MTIRRWLTHILSETDQSHSTDERIKNLESKVGNLDKKIDKLVEELDPEKINQKLSELFEQLENRRSKENRFFK